jgi:ubiquinone/menaquinone biosynthesis C-methylase UbiE
MDWSRGFAALYEPSLWLGERMGMRQRRRAVLAQARGRVVEIGAGTGLNVPHYPEGVSELILTEPDPSMVRRLTRRGHGRATVVTAPADRLPVEDGSVDTVVSTLVLCTVDDPAATLREIRRVLRPDGQLLLIEHVRAEGRLLAAAQRLFRRPWRAFACGCRCDRATPVLLHAAGFRAELRSERWRAMPPIIGPLVVGRAVPA